MELIKPNNINYKTVAQASGKYRYLRLALNNITGSQITISPNASQLLEWKLPVGVYNLARSYYQATDSNVIDATGVVYAYDNTLPIAQSIQFGTAGGFNLCDLNYANNYINVARPIDTDVDTFLTNDVASKFSHFDYPQCTGGNTLFNAFPPTLDPAQNNMYSIPDAVTSIDPSVCGIQHVRQSITASKGLLGVTQFPFAGVTNTILAMDRDQYFPDNMYLRIQTAVTTKVAFAATAINAPATGSANLAAQPILKDIYLYLAMEQDNLIIESLMAKYASGNLKYQVPYTTAFRNAVGAGASTVQIQLNSQYGKKLKRVLTTFYNTNELTGGASSHLAYDHNNHNALKVTSYQTYVNSKPMQDSICSCAQPASTDALILAGTAGATGLDDWRENKASCKNTAVKTSLQYQMGWFHADNFYERNMESGIPQDNIDQGVSLVEPIAWSIQSTNASALTNYTFCHFSRDVQITPAGPLWV